MSANKKDPDSWLKEFKVEISSSSSLLYGNAYQQVEIRLTANVQQNQPALTPEQFESLVLVLEHPDGTYEQLPEPGASTLDWWQARTRDERFDFMSGTLKTEAPKAVSKPLYVSSRMGSGSAVKLRARIQKDNDTVYYTDLQHGFDSYVTVTIKAPPIFNEESYLVQQTITEGNINNVFLHEYSVRPRAVNFSVLHTRDVDGMIRWQSNNSSERYATYVGIAMPGNRTINYNSAIEKGSVFVPNREIKTPATNSLILVLHGADNIPFYAEGLNHQGPCSVLVIDRQGNTHNLLFNFSNEGSALEKRTKIVVGYNP